MAHGGDGDATERLGCFMVTFLASFWRSQEKTASAPKRDSLGAENAQKH
jgi:hypothetical protein